MRYTSATSTIYRKEGTYVTIDVVVVTKDGTLPEGLEHIPTNNLIIDTSKPLGWARQRAIQKVTTEWFAFIDDDVKIDPNWFNLLIPYTHRPGIGAVQGTLLVKGLGDAFDEAINSTQKNDIEERRKPDSVGHTHNTLIKTELVKNWLPSRDDLNAFEDYEITQHIIGQEYRWLVIPTESAHYWSWSKLAKNAIWANKWWKRVFSPTRKQILKRIRGFIKMSFRHLRKRGVRVFVYYVWFRFFCVWGLLFA